MVAFIVLLAVLAVIVLGVEALARAFRLPLELTRKATHILTGVAVALAPPSVTQPYLVVLALLFILVIWVSRARGIFRSIHDPERRGIGELWYPIGILAAAVFFPEPRLFTYAVLILSVADGLAGLVGKLYGRRRIPLAGSRKTYLGSEAFVVSAFIISLSVLPPVMALSAAIILALIELVSVRGIDNVLLPLAAGLIGLSFAV